MKPKIVCLDPGHPSEVGSGTRGRHLTEIQVAWQMARAMQKGLEARGIQTVLTKQQEHEFVTNRKRAEIANQAQADLMVRLHCDSEGGSGIATFYPDRAGHGQNSFRGPSVAVLRASTLAAHRFHAALIKALHGKLRNRGVLPDTQTKIGGKQGALTGSIYSEVPVLLVEMCVLTHRADEDFVASPTGQKILADALVSGTLAALESIAPV